jgi:phosphoribosylamine--glycine ligase
MGSYSPVRGADAAFVDEIVETVHRPVVAELAARGTPFTGLLYAGVMLTPDGPRVLEFNARFGDPETQSILPRLDGDLLEALHAAATASLHGVALGAAERAAVTVVLAGGSYPEASDSGTPIAGVEEAEATGALVFHAGTALHHGALVTNGGRILDVTGVGETVAEARERAYAAVELISWPGMRYRRDIAGAVHV